jgi:hypothetical protein
MNKSEYLDAGGHIFRLDQIREARKNGNEYEVYLDSGNMVRISLGAKDRGAERVRKILENILNPTSLYDF